MSKNPRKGWAPTTKEALALILAVCHWHVYLAGKRFTLNSDHNPMVHMLDRTERLAWKFARWITELEEFDYTIRYVPGVENVKADALSRNTQTEASQPESPLEEKIYRIWSGETFRIQVKVEQDKDPVISVVKRHLRFKEKNSQGSYKKV